MYGDRKVWVLAMKKLPDAEQELMMIVWNSEEPISRMDIEKKMTSDKNVVPSTILSLLSRLENRGFLRKEKQGIVNYYYALVDKDAYLQEMSHEVLDKMFGSSLANFVAALNGGKRLDREDIAELQAYIDEQTREE